MVVGNRGGLFTPALVEDPILTHQILLCDVDDVDGRFRYLQVRSQLAQMRTCTGVKDNDDVVLAGFRARA
jgi:hypothetical protein